MVTTTKGKNKKKMNVKNLTEEQVSRLLTLVQASVDILDKQKRGYYVRSFFEGTAVWDGVECDGYCYHEEASELLRELGYEGNGGQKL